MDDHYKIKLTMRGQGLVPRPASWTEPECAYDDTGRLTGIKAEFIEGKPEYGDSIGYLDYSEVSSIAWHFVAGGPSKDDKQKITADNDIEMVRLVLLRSVKPLTFTGIVNKTAISEARVRLAVKALLGTQEIRMRLRMISGHQRECYEVP
jgi:hypothetical protein